ncbi:response regulator transcription factor [Sphingobacterium spiritivorum]|uniref:Response regulator receiver domain protein n=2 Tax=Sphingobacterium spiritivorum TaxID=258 RepID=D7VN12_SPHSI|nr:response regulator transcription factor [Sphingobacterium spiritivorum]EEI93939.1 response regulator receiver domain protein [Sphingobacterium spiritivorum ATCC 33300]EFK57309.1 response regulator receiver domain protein [Sphingobacterium spiritivorum ATCC 33861]QQS94408.1 response regulator transcription factor [Sphingobacterium spiritivorum]QQT36609.1 response regulator transcription factor [Sphingobacterium spiritivorum]WQD33360.1 response regulator transcription factor [Sphingobacterium
MQILLVEDDARISDFIVKGLEENGFNVQLCVSAEEAREVVFEHSFDVIIMDVMLPGIDGIQLTKMIRYKKNLTPILMLSALNEAEDKIAALDSGADDFLVKPFHFKELISRINALTRRTKYQKQEVLSNSLVIQNLKIDRDKYAVYQDGEKIELSPKEFKLLLYLAENTDKVVSRTMVLNAVWGINFDNNTNVVDVYISYLRNKIDESKHQFILTVKGTGYMFQG